MKHSKKIKLVLDLLKDEVKGDTKSALKKITKDYTMTWVYKSKDGLFPTEKVKSENDIKDIYNIKRRKYEIKNIAEGKDVVMIEMIESYPDPKTKKVFKTPLVIVLEFKNGKVRTGRHYCDPRISFMNLSKREISKIYKNNNEKRIIIK